MRIIRVIKWLLKDAPLNITETGMTGAKCDYCGREHDLVVNRNLTFCWFCLKAALDEHFKKGVTDNGN